MFCFTCKREVNFVECKPFSNKYNYNDFLLEFYGKNFDEKGNRIKEYNVFKSEVVNTLNKYHITIDEFLKMAKYNEGEEK